MKSTDKSKKDPASITIEVNQSYKVLEDLTRQVLGDIRARMENLRGENEQPFTQAMLAKSLDINPSNISKIMNGDTNLTLRTISNIAAATGSKCYFHLARDPSSELNFEFQGKSNSGAAHWMNWTTKGGKKRANGLSFPGMIKAARDYVDQIIEEDGLFNKGENERYSVEVLDENNRAGLHRDVERDHGVQIHVSGKEILCIIAEFTFSDGFSDIEWVLYDIGRTEHFRSRDLQQVARLAAVVMSRDGFQR